MKHLHIVVSGKVQGVFFRDNTKRCAEHLHITGAVRNTVDGNVVIDAEGDDEPLQAFLDWCHHGPPEAVVNGVRVTETPMIGYHRFEVTY